ncbi:MAG: hypothetical protein FJW23_03560 [Acidimicrobiia bacterium]|nr:hypothetical protein [Acidimicrobiia bacterium]
MRVQTHGSGRLPSWLRPRKPAPACGIAAALVIVAMAVPAVAATPTVFDQRTVSHIGMVVRDVEKTSRAIADVFGLTAPPVRDTKPVPLADGYTGDPKAHTREAQVRFDNIVLRVIQPVGGKSPWRDLLDRRHGAHYINFFVEDVNATDAYLTSRGGHRILGNKTAPYSYNDMHDALGGLTVLLLRAAPPQGR